jgi:ribosomal protein S18 acetylase RimI-like enzyme
MFQFIESSVQELALFRDISVKTYRETFEADNDPAEFANYLAEAFNPSALTALLDDPQYHVWMLSHEDKVAGYCALRDYPPSYSVIEGRHPIEIQRFYVDSQYQGEGIGQRMMTFALEQTRVLSGDSVWLGVWEHNHKAQRFYGKQGFRVVGQHDFWVGNDRQNDLLMQRFL